MHGNIVITLDYMICLLEGSLTSTCSPIGPLVLFWPNFSQAGLNHNIQDLEVMFGECNDCESENVHL